MFIGCISIFAFLTKSFRGGQLAMARCCTVYWILFIAADCSDGVPSELVLMDKPDVRRLIEA